MTVSKVTDALLNRRVIRQTKPPKASAGRRAGLLSLNSDFFTIVLDLTEKNFVFTVINAKQEAINTSVFSYNDNFLFRENLQRFLKDSAEYLEHSLPKTLCMGIGVAVPGCYLPEADRIDSDLLPEFGSLSVLEMTRTAFEDLPIQIDTATNAAALSNAACAGLKTDEMALYCYIGEQVIRAALLRGDHIMSGAHRSAAQLAKIQLTQGVTLQNSITSRTTKKETASLLAHAFCNTILLLDPVAILLECQNKETTGVLSDAVHEALIDEFKFDPNKLPPILSANAAVPHAHRGLSLSIRQVWLTRLVMEE